MAPSSVGALEGELDGSRDGDSLGDSDGASLGSVLGSNVWPAAVGTLVVGVAVEGELVGSYVFPGTSGARVTMIGLDVGARVDGERVGGVDGACV